MYSFSRTWRRGRTAAVAAATLTFASVGLAPESAPAQSQFGTGIGKGRNFGSSFGLGLTRQNRPSQYSHATYGSYGNTGYYGHHHHHDAGYGVGYLPPVFRGYTPGFYNPGGLYQPDLGYGYGYGYGGSYGYGTSGFGVSVGGVVGPATSVGGAYGYGDYGYVTPGYGATGYGAAGYGAAAYGRTGYGTPGLGWGAAYSPDGVWRDPINNRILQAEYDADWARWTAAQANGVVSGNLENPSDPADLPQAPPASSPEALQRSARYQAQGDEFFRNQQYAKALERYRTAAQTTRDDGDAYLRAGVTYVAMNRFEQAIPYLRRGVQLDPSAAMTGTTLSELYGPDQKLAQTAHLHSATAWVKEQYRDPDRLFLLGVLLLMDRSHQAREFLETAWRLGGDRDGLRPLLSALSAEALPAKITPDATPDRNDTPAAGGNAAPSLPLPAENSPEDLGPSQDLEPSQDSGLGSAVTTPPLLGNPPAGDQSDDDGQLGVMVPAAPQMNAPDNPPQLAPPAAEGDNPSDSGAPAVSWPPLPTDDPPTVSEAAGPGYGGPLFPLPSQQENRK